MMTDREKIIKGLEEVVNCFQEEVDEWSNYTDEELRHGTTVDCNWFFGVLKKCKAALSMLKVQEPRLLTLEEVQGLPYDGHVILEVDVCDDSRRMYSALLFCKDTVNYDTEFITTEGKLGLRNDHYGRTWRCWSSRPTDEQREATPWEN